jgi:hypothetical protein
MTSERMISGVDAVGIWVLPRGKYYPVSDSSMGEALLAAHNTAVLYDINSLPTICQRKIPSFSNPNYTSSEVAIPY